MRGNTNNGESNKMKKIDNRTVEEPGYFKIDISARNISRYWQEEKYAELFQESARPQKGVYVVISLHSNEKWILPDRAMTQDERIEVFNNFKKALLFLGGEAIIEYVEVKLPPGSVTDEAMS